MTTETTKFVNVTITSIATIGGLMLIFAPLSPLQAALAIIGSMFIIGAFVINEIVPWLQDRLTRARTINFLTMAFGVLCFALKQSGVLGKSLSMIILVTGIVFMGMRLFFPAKD